MHPCAAEIAAAEPALAAGGDRAVGVNALRALHAQAARQLLGAAPGDLLDALVIATAEVAPLARAAAIGHLRAAEALQWEIGGWSTSAGEGLDSLREVRDLQLALAWLLTVPPAEGAISAWRWAATRCRSASTASTSRWASRASSGIRARR